MNEVLKNIYSRHSVRSYLDQQITEAELTEVLEAGLQAPSAMNQQSWFFVAVQASDKREAVRKLCVSACSMPEDANPFYGAPTIVLVFAKEGNFAPQMDAALAMENMMLAAHSIGLGSCWINCVIPAFSSDAGKALAAELGVPEGYLPAGSLALGLPAAQNTKEKQVEKKYRIIR